MVDEKQIKQWVKEGTINETQAKKMLADTSKYKKEERSNKLIISISTIGAILLGIGAILFIASNWQVIPNLIKILILVGSTFGMYYLGYFFKYQKQNLPTVGASLIFLGALLFGATIFLIAQMYNINANNNFLLLIWLVGVLPLVYALVSVPLAGLSCIIFYIWIALFIFNNLEFWQGKGDIFLLPTLYLVLGILLFAVGALHYLSDGLKNIARTYRIIGLKVIMVCLFLLTFRFFSGVLREGEIISTQFTIIFLIFCVLAIIFTFINLFFNPQQSDTHILENSISLGLLAIALIFFFFPASNNIYIILFNLILAGIIFTILFVGYNREDMTLINMGMFWLAILIIVRYFDFFWDLLPRSVFFMVGGLILVLGGIALERKREQLKSQFHT